jgi:hypothetical protein
VHDHDPAVRRHAHIELQGIHARRNRLPEGLERILRRLRRVAAVADDGAEGGIEERVHLELARDAAGIGGGGVGNRGDEERGTRGVAIQLESDYPPFVFSQLITPRPCPLTSAP